MGVLGVSRAVMEPKTELVPCASARNQIDQEIKLRDSYWLVTGGDRHWWFPQYFTVN